MWGGKGNDLYRVDSSGDDVFETGPLSSGTDRVIATVSHRLDSGVENLTLRGHNLSGYGNALANVITGTNGRNLLDGEGGRDTLKALGGRDAYQFDTKLASNNIDHIVSFSHADDTVRIDNAIFKGLPTGTLAAYRFKDLAQDSADSNDRILYNSNSGTLSYDSNGSGGGHRKVFAIIDNDPILTASDFFVV